ncbi:MAG: hypothetical protein JWN03_8464 [Nocardia sp.]|nr:hypothetical protein [Nocardia sp.]
MRGRITGLAVVPVGALAAAITLGGVGVALLVGSSIFGATMSGWVSSDLQYQCDSQVGADPSGAQTTSVVPTSNAGVGSDWAVDVPTENPYASLTLDPDDTGISSYQRGCVSALKSAPYQLPPLQTVNAGFAADCARSLALAQVNQLVAGSPGGVAGSPDAADNPLDSADLQRYVIFEASSATASGHCGEPGGTNPGSATSPRLSASDLMPADPGSCARVPGAASGPGNPAALLPNFLAGQGLCGQRVDIRAASPGDLIFWNYSNGAATSGGIVVGPAQIVTADPSSGRVVARPMPTGPDVRVKRVLSGGS